jgi:hypothetical protein
MFKFSQGGLTSDIVDQDRIQHAFYDHGEGGTPKVILEADYEAYGIGSFCVRALCGAAKSSSAKEGVNIRYSIVLFPVSKAELLQKYEGAKEAAWPGILTAEGECPMLIKAESAWGCPVWPVLLTGEDLMQQPRLPSGSELRMAIASVMMNAVAPETSRSVKSLLGRWRKLAANPEELVAKKSQPEWPRPQQRPNETGK